MKLRRMTTDAQRRFERILREQARVADRMSTTAYPAAAERDQFRADKLREAADEFPTRMPPDQLASLEYMSDDDMRALVMGARMVPAWITRRA
jgi:hypothetical protein